MRVCRGRQGFSQMRRKMQRGRGMPVHRSNIRLQRGRGLGSLFAKFIPWIQPLISKIGPKLLTSAKTIVKSPLAKKVLTVAKEAAKAGGAEVAGELIKGNKTNAKTSMKQHVGNARNKIGTLIQESGQTPKANHGPPGKRVGRKKPVKKRKGKISKKNTLV